VYVDTLVKCAQMTGKSCAVDPCLRLFFNFLNIFRNILSQIFIVKCLEESLLIGMGKSVASKLSMFTEDPFKLIGS